MTKRPLSFGATVWTFSWVPPYEGAIRRVARTGCKAIELVGWDEETLKSYYTPARIKDLRALMADEGLRPTNFFHNLPFTPQPGAKLSKPGLESFARAVDVAAALGSPFVTTMTPYPFGRDVAPIMRRPTSQEWSAPVEPQWDWTGEYGQMVETFAKACEIAAKAGLRVAVEPHPYRWVNSGQSMARLIERVGSPHLGLNFDPSHLFPSGDMPHFTVLMLKERIFNTHFSDNDGHTNAHWRPGRGKIDWVAVLAALQAIGYDGPITLELEDAPGASHWTHTGDATERLDDEMKRAIAYLRERWDEVAG